MPTTTDTDSIIALVYRRVSTYKQERDGVSLDVQDQQCLDYIRRQPGWRLGGDFQDTLTGRTAKRHNYQRLLEEVRQLHAQGQRVAVVTAALDRMGRDLEESVRSRRELRDLEVPLHCIREGGVLQELQADIYASIAADESRKIAARVKGTRKLNRDRGYRGPSRAPWGYVWAPASDMERLADAPRNVLRPDSATAEYVQEAWRRVAGGESVRQVARWVQGLTSEARGGRAFSFGNVLGMLKNPTYIARVAAPNRNRKGTSGRKVVVPDLEALALPRGRWQPLVDDETWTAVQERIARHHHMPKQARGEYLLTGLLRCPKCGRRMQGQNSTGWARVYSCSTPGSGCKYTGRADVIDRALLDAVRQVLTSLGGGAALRVELGAEWAKLQKPPSRPGQRRIATLERVIARARRRQDEMLALLADRVITREKYGRADAAEQADIEAAQRELAEIRAAEAPPVLPPLADVLRAAGGWGEIVAGADVPAQRAVLGDLIERVVPERIGYGKYEARIEWTPLGKALRQLSEALPDDSERRRSGGVAVGLAAISPSAVQSAPFPHGAPR